MPQIDRAAIKNYFKPFPVWAVLCIIIGVPLIALYGIGLSPIAVGVLALVFNKKPTDQQMDEWLAEEIKFLNEKALSKLGIDASHCVRQPIVVYGPRVENTGFPPGSHLIFRYLVAGGSFPPGSHLIFRYLVAGGSILVM
jgi:hypothetical protein